jgi:cyclophilin family peptidyl-prolyl cis-trans isomerase
MKKISFLLFLFSVIVVFSDCSKDETTVINPLATTEAATSITSSSAQLNGEVIANTEATSVEFEWGLTTLYGNKVAADQNPVPPNAKTKVTATLDSLKDNTTYHFRLVSKHQTGTKYGTDMTFTTSEKVYELMLIHTGFGNMLIWLYDQTPLHKANYLNLAKTKYFDSLTFHRVVENFVIQGGDPLGNGTGGPGYTIPAEFNDSLTHVYGAVGAARDNNPQKNSNGSQFYIVVNKPGTHFLDKNYTVFGIVIDGMPAADAIALVPNTGSPNNTPLSKVYMTKVEVVGYSASQLKSLFNFSIPTF